MRYRTDMVETGFANFTLGSVKDWMVLDRERISEQGLILLALRELANLHVDVTEVSAPDRTIGRRLMRLGLVKQGRWLFW